LLRENCIKTFLKDIRDCNCKNWVYEKKLPSYSKVFSKSLSPVFLDTLFLIEGSFYIIS
jgi:hypothetical protein